MITKIQSIKNIRSFINFNSDSELKRKNIIYSPNGTGKTNLSRIFEYLKKGKDLEKLKSQEADILDKVEYCFTFDQVKINQNNFKDNNAEFKNILIFNSDFIEENVRCENFSKKDVSGEIQIPIGKEGTAISSLEDIIDTNKKERVRQYESVKKAIKKLKDEKIKNKEYKTNDLNIWKNFSIDNLIDGKSFQITKPEDQEEFLTCESDFKGILSLDEDQEINFNIKEIELSEINFFEIQNILKTPKIFTSFDEETKNNIEFLTKNWIETDLIQKGIEKSKEQNKCLLCKRELNDSVNSLFSKYEKYFADEESKFKKEIKKHETNIGVLKDQLLLVNNNSKSEAERLIKILGLKEEWIDLLDTSKLLTKTTELIDKLTQKGENPSEILTVNVESDSKEQKEKVEYNFVEVFKTLNLSIQNNKILIDKINDKIKKTTERKAELRAFIGKKFLYKFYKENKSNFDNIYNYSKIIAEKAKLLEQEKAKLPKREVSKTIEELCNTFLHDYLQLKKYSIEENNGNLSLKLNTKDISSQTEKISEGEKNIIAFCYFLASSIQELKNPEKFLKAIFIIDDPVCSTSYNYFFGICNLTRFFEEIIFKKLWEDDLNKIIQSSPQKIILTHNTPFFNMLRGHVFKDNQNSKYFLLTNLTLNEIPRKQLKSEFEMALYNIKKATITPTNEHNIGNDLRRFFETLKHFYGFSENFNANSLKKIFPDFRENDHLIFYSVVQYYSHGNPEAHNDPLPVNFKPFITQFNNLITKSQFSELWKRIEN